MLKKIILTIFPMLIIMCCVNFAHAEFKYDDPLNLTTDPTIEHKSYTYNNTTMYYSETNENQQKNDVQTIILVLHSGVQRSNLHQLKHITNPGFQSLVRYVRKHHIKTVIIAPQYPLAANKDAYRYPQKYNELVIQLMKDKIKEYNIPKERILVVGTCVGGIALSDILNDNQDFFAKAAFVASKNMDAKNFRESEFKTKLYLVQGDKDSIKYKIDLVEYLKNKNFDVTLKILKDTNHLKSLEMDVGYPDYLWRWLFKYDYDSLDCFFRYVKMYFANMYHNIKDKIKP